MANENIFVDPPSELHAPLLTKETCGNCKSSANSLLLCTACRTVYYCSKECQIEDWKKHKNGCKQVKSFRKAYTNATATTEALDIGMIHQVIFSSGREFPATDIVDVAGLNRNINQPILRAMNGFLGIDVMTRRYVQARLNLAFELMWQGRATKSAFVYQEALDHLLDIKKLTHRWQPYLVDKEIVWVLLKLYRDDDAASFVCHWCKADNPDEALCGKVVDKWPFPRQESSRFLDLMRVFSENMVNIESRIESMYTVPGYLTMDGSEGCPWANIQLMLLPILVLKARVLTILRHRMSIFDALLLTPEHRLNMFMQSQTAEGLTGNGTPEVLCQQLLQTRPILEHLGKFCDDGMLEMIPKHLRDPKFKDPASRPIVTGTHGYSRLFAAFFSDEGPVIDTMADLMRVHASFSQGLQNNAGEG